MSRRRALAGIALALAACSTAPTPAAVTLPGGAGAGVRAARFAAIDFAADIPDSSLVDASAVGLSFQVSAARRPGEVDANQCLVRVRNDGPEPIAFMALNWDPWLHVVRRTSHGTWRHVGSGKGNGHADARDLVVLEVGEEQSAMLDAAWLEGETRIGVWIDGRRPGPLDEDRYVTFAEAEDPARQGYVWSAPARAGGSASPPTSPARAR